MKDRLLSLATLLAFCASTHASTYYVDAVGGSDANAGTSSLAAWKTITFAMSQIPTGIHELRVAPGTYDAAHGESWPVLYPADLSLIGTGGAAATILDATGASSAFRLDSSVTNPAHYHYQSTKINGVTIVGGHNGIEMTGSVLFTILSVSNSRITNAIGPAIQVTRTGGSMGISLLSSTIDHCGDGIVFDAGAGSNPSLGGGMIISGSTIRDNVGDGARFLTTFGDAPCIVDRSRLERNGGDGFHFVGLQSSTQLNATSSSFSGNAGSGIREEIFVFPQLKLLLTLSACTVAHNASTGVSTNDPSISNSILWGNALDIAGVNDGVNSSDVGTGIVLGSGNLSVDPLFVNPAALDFRLPWFSPLIDAGSTFGSGQDLVGGVRLADGDLDTTWRVDMGAHEFQTLTLIGAPVIGTTPVMSFFGQPGSTSVLLLSPTLAPGGGISTKYGSLKIHPSAPWVYFPPVAAGISPQGMLPLAIPNDPTLVGATAYFQAITSSADAGPGLAFTNLVTLKIAN